MKKHIIAIIGGGMAGLCAAIRAAQIKKKSTTVMLFDVGEMPGRKILATGNGRCNLANRVQSESCYRSENGHAGMRLYSDGWDQEVITFFSSIGVLTHERKGYIYPRTDQASTVQLSLVKAARDLGVVIKPLSRVTSLLFDETSNRFVAGGMDGGDSFSILADRVVLACGGMVSSLYGCRGDGYRLAKNFGHTLIPTRPALCALRSDEPFLKIAAGVRTSARVYLYTDTLLEAQSEGEIQMLSNGISGIPIFQVSRYAYPFLGEEGKEKRLWIDFLPELGDAAWEEECQRRILSALPGDTLGDFCRGLVPDKIAGWILAGMGQVREKKIANLAKRKQEREKTLRMILDVCKKKQIRITGTEDFEKAQVCAGGIPLCEIKDTMESLCQPGLYFAGEVLDVDGICGGYNLTFAVHSGLLAGKEAANSLL